MKYQRGVTYVCTFRGFFEVQWPAREVEAGCEVTAGPADPLMHALLTQQSHEVILNGVILDYITNSTLNCKMFYDYIQLRWIILHYCHSLPCKAMSCNAM